MLKKLLLPPVVLFLAACGQKGPLYLPQDPAVPTPPPATEIPTSTAPGEETDGEKVEIEQEAEETAESTVTGPESTSEK